MKRLLLPAAISISVAALAQAPPPEFDFTQGIEFNLASYSPAGPKTDVKNQVVALAEVAVSFCNYDDSRGHWQKYYFQELEDHPEKYQPQLRAAISTFLQHKGFKVVTPKEQPGAPIIKAYFKIRENLSPKGVPTSDGKNTLFSTVDKVSMMVDFTLAWYRPGALSISTMDENIEIWSITNYNTKRKVEPSLGGGFKALVAGYPGREALKHKPFVESIDSVISEAITKGLDKMSSSLDQEAILDAMRRVRNKF